MRWPAIQKSIARLSPRLRPWLFSRANVRFALDDLLDVGAAVADGHRNHGADADLDDLVVLAGDEGIAAVEGNDGCLDFGNAVTGVLSIV